MFPMFQGGKKLAAVAVLAAGFATFASPRAYADVTVGLDTLVDDLSTPEVDEALTRGVTVGDKRYSNFQFRSSGSTVLTPDAVEVMVMESGNRHDLFFMFDLEADPGERSDLVLGYDLTVLGSNSIRRIDAMFDGSPMGPGNGRGAVTMIETVSTLDGSDLLPGGAAQSTELFSLFNDGDDVGLPDTLEVGAAINPSRGLRFLKDIIVSSRPNGPTMSLSIVQQGTEQTVIPLPAAFWAAIPVFGALVGRRKLAKVMPSRES